MAPLKYEEQMKDKLEKRSLQPSPESWATLSNRLDAEQKGKTKNIFWWIGIAASIVGIMFVTTMYFNNQPIENGEKNVVDTEENTIQKEQPQNQNEIIEIPTTSEEVVVEETKPTTNPIKEAVSNTTVNTKISKSNLLEEELAQQDAVAHTQEDNLKNDITSNAVEDISEIKSSELTFEKQKIQDVVAQIKDLKANGNNVTNAEIDSLLKKAQKEILSNRLYNENTRTVDANALLQDVEDDLQQSFRSKVFEALQSGYESVKTAVVQKNN